MNEEILSALTYTDGVLYWKQSGKKAGTTRADGRVSIRFKSKPYLRSRIVYYMFTGEQPTVVEHIDTNCNNDAIENLRGATQCQNRHNQGKVVAKSGYKGVHWANGTWVARIKTKGVTHILGYSKDPIECARLYDQAAKEFFGDFSNLNFKETK